MLLRPCLLLVSLCSAVSAIVAEIRVTNIGHAGPARPFRKTISDNVITLKKSRLRTSSSAALLELIASAQNATTPLISTAFGAGYAVDVDFEGENFLLLFDTGSADTWVASSTFKCVNYRGVEFPNEFCNFGPLFEGDFPEGPIPNQNFRVSYGSGEFVTGETGVMDIAIAGLRIDGQRVALVDRAFWDGDGVTSGITGFAYRALTSSYLGDNTTADDPKTNLINYSPVIQTALEHDIFETFALAFERSEDGPAGYLALGGLPPVTYKKPFSSTPIKITDLTQVGRSGKAYSFYTIRPDSFTYSAGRNNRYQTGRTGTRVPANFDVIIDSGTTLSYLPATLVSSIMSQYRPAARYIKSGSQGLWEVACNATVPDVHICINGTNFAFSKEDLVLQGDLGFDPTTGLCLTGIQQASRVSILGDTFLKNVLTVFDFAQGYMRFAAR